MVKGRGRFGDLLRSYRAAANLTQEELAERAGLSMHAISMLERGVRQAPRPTTVVQLSKALGLDAAQHEALAAAVPRRASPGTSNERELDVGDAQALLASMPTDVLPPRGPLPPGSRMLLAPNPLFVGRDQELLRVAAALKGGDTVSLAQLVASTGLGGLGKTQLAVELVHRWGRFFAGGVFWLSFASIQEIPLQVAACGAPGTDGVSLAARLELVREAWQSPVPRLLVFDNCEEETLLEAWRPASGGCRVLVTSRRSRWSPALGVNSLPLDVLPRQDSVELLRRYRPDLAASEPGLDAVADEVGDLPLALHLMGSYLRAYRTDVGLEEYLAELRQPEVLRHASLLGAGLDDSPSPTHHVQNLAQTFAVCLSRLDGDREIDRVAIALLARMACLAPGEAVPRDFLCRTLAGVDPLRQSDGLRRLGAVGLVEEAEGRLRVHRLLVHFLRHETLDPDAEPAVHRALIDCGEAAECGLLTGRELAAMIPHLVDAAGRDPAGGQPPGGIARAAGQVLCRAGDFRSAGPWLERVVAIRERMLGHEHPDTAGSLNDLADLLWLQGAPAPARPLYERALAIRERRLGPDHPDTARALNDLALVLRDQGDLAQSRLLVERAAAIRERALGPDHPDTCQSFCNLGVVLQELGDLAAAAALQERALAILERVRGPDHPDIAVPLTGLGVVLRLQGELADARRRLERAVSIREQAFGPVDQYTANSVHHLGVVLRDQGDPAARSVLERALTAFEQVFGSDHFKTAFCLHSLALLYRGEGDLTTARRLLERVVAISDRTLGPDHPRAAAARGDLAELTR